MADTGPDTILLDLFRTNQVRERLIAAALEGLPLPPDDYPFYVLIGAEGPLTPTAHAERRENPDDRRSYLLALTPEGQKLLREARPRFRASAEAVEARLGKQVDGLRTALGDLREAIETELSS